MNQYKVLFLPHNKEVIVKDGENLIRAAMKAGVHINASCGGEGVCGKCRVLIEDGNVDGGTSEKLSREDYAAGYRQACLSSVKSDIVVRVPIESSIDANVLKAWSSPRRAAGVREVNFEQFKKNGRFLPPVEKKYIELPKPTAKDNLPDVARLISYLKSRYNEQRLVVDLPVIRKIPDIFREDNFNITVTLARPVQIGRKTHIINIQPGDLTGKNYAIALDIGTTTIYGYLVDVNTGSIMALYGDFNRQISYGEDVIARLVYAEKPEGLEKLHDVVVEIVNHIIKKMVQEAEIDPEQISVIILAGNTTMTQLMLKVNPKYIRRSPYVPASALYPPIKAVDLNIMVGEHVSALIFPAISSYVGGDIVAGVISSGMYNAEELTLYMDIGTNAEVVIGNKDWLVCAACSAGPAFEGGGIKFGMRAIEGAIEDFSIDPLTLEPMNITVGNVRPRGICGSGLINIVAALFETGVIDNIGRFNRDLDTNRIRRQDGVYEYVLAWTDENGIDKDIVLTEPDIDNLIRAKGALYSGCITLLEEVGIGFHDIDRIVLAGGFGSYIGLERAMTIGLLPEIDPDKFTYIGNGSLIGATVCCLANHIRKEVVEITRRMTNFELSETASYMNNYMASLFLPHTDMSRFPGIKQRLEARKGRDFEGRVKST
ncbi:MAG: ASKHA domain-containing protein [Thermodesulfobacteriota bacterium]|nr:ASKHA domain-containing protein [Thermodesulfobacteriota bacterium]